MKNVINKHNLNNYFLNCIFRHGEAQEFEISIHTAKYYVRRRKAAIREQMGKQTIEKKAELLMP